MTEFIKITPVQTPAPRRQIREPWWTLLLVFSGLILGYVAACIW